MKAVGAFRTLPVSDPQCLVDVEMAQPSPGPRDLLVKVMGIGVNPVDTKVRASLGATALTEPRVLGWDAAGVVVAVGADVRDFAVGDEVYYAGDVTRPGCNSEFQCVDERLVALKPGTLAMEQAAALPLTSLTAWELLFERMGIDPEGTHAGQALLIINGAGGVGSMAIQLARAAGLFVIATASRPETQAWCRELGANEVIDHRGDLAAQLAAHGHHEVPWIVNFSNTERYWEFVGQCIAPLGAVGLIVEPATPLRVGDPYKMKCVRICWEFMAARAKFKTPDMARQGQILTEIARRIDAGDLIGTCTRTLSPINADNLREAHAAMETGTAIGKWTLRNWL